jgi:hypothetical protein
MGHKGVSKRKPKKSKSFSNDGANNSSSAHSGERPLVESLIKDKGAPLHKGGANPLVGSNKTQEKR